MKIQNHRKSEVIQVIRTTTLEGRGTREDVYREVTYFHALDGELLAVSDPLPVEARKAPAPESER